MGIAKSSANPRLVLPEGSEQGLLASYGVEKPLPLRHDWYDAGANAQRLPDIGRGASACVYLTDCISLRFPEKSDRLKLQDNAGDVYG